MRTKDDRHMSPKRLYLALCVVGTFPPATRPRLPTVLRPTLRQPGERLLRVGCHRFLHGVVGLGDHRGAARAEGGGATLGADRRESDCWRLPWAAVVPLHA